MRHHTPDYARSDEEEAVDPAGAHGRGDEEPGSPWNSSGTSDAGRLVGAPSGPAGKVTLTLGSRDFFWLQVRPPQMEAHR